jgi:trk system potassium uptake protein
VGRERGQKIDPQAKLPVSLTFIVLIAFGMAMLLLPFVQYQEGISLLDTLFMATSAVCVTGLVTVPTSGFNPAGQLILLLLIQLGAIGIMTIGSSLLLFLHGELNLPQRLRVAGVTEPYALREVEGVLAMVLAYTLIMEAAGLAALTIGFSLEGYELSDSVYLAFFHTISAFCNAGFSPLDTSLVGVNWFIKVTVMILIIMGGLGYYVVFELFSRPRQPHRRLSIHSRLVLYGTIFLLGTGALLPYLIEGQALGWLDALFLSATARTAGFNTVDLAGLHSASLFLLLLLMVIGAAPGSTAGGVKLTTFLVSLLFVSSAIRGREQVVIFGRRLPLATVLRAYTLIMLYLGFVGLGTGLLLYTEGAPLLATLFEMTSATGTVGLTLGLTPELSAMGKVIIIIGMFGGRVGPAILVLTFLRPKSASRLHYPEEKIMLG